MAGKVTTTDIVKCNGMTAYRRVDYLEVETGLLAERGSEASMGDPYRFADNIGRYMPV